jgi:hypothetical protein
MTIVGGDTSPRLICWFHATRRSGRFTAVIVS